MNNAVLRFHWIWRDRHYTRKCEIRSAQYQSASSSRCCLSSWLTSASPRFRHSCGPTGINLRPHRCPVFEQAGMPVAKWIITVGALAGLSTSLLGAIFPLPRVLYAMASDGLIFRNLANVHPRFKTPLLATFISGFLAGGWHWCLTLRSSLIWCQLVNMH